jgi:plastocyanin
LFSLLAFTTLAQKPRTVTVIIPEHSSISTEDSNFQPALIKVAIDVNNTVRWINKDVVGSSVVANDKSDPDFYDATYDDVNDRPKAWLDQGETFEFTFTRPGEFGYHGEPHPWKRGTVIVLAPTS